MTVPESPDPPDTRPRLPQPHGGVLIPGGKPGNRGGRGRPKQRIVIAAGKNLARELGRLERAADPSNDVKCPDCGREFKVLLVKGMDARTRIAYAQLLANLQATDPDAGEPPTTIMVLTGTAADMVDSTTEAPAGIEYVDGTQLEPPRDAGRRA